MIDLPQVATLMYPISIYFYGYHEDDTIEYDYHEMREMGYLNLGKESVEVLIDYPLETPVILTINPMIRMYHDKEYLSCPIGYACWQIVLGYAHIFKNEYEKAGVWGHSLSDLQLAELNIYDSGHITLTVDS